MSRDGTLKVARLSLAWGSNAPPGRFKFNNAPYSWYKARCWTGMAGLHPTFSWRDASLPRCSPGKPFSGRSQSRVLCRIVACLGPI
jgi:hypothetical protein